MGNSFDSIINGAHDALDKVEGSVGGSISGGGNTVLDPAPEMSKIISDIFAAIIEVFAFFRNMFKVA